jgi:hypothetical protein
MSSLIVECCWRIVSGPLLVQERVSLLSGRATGCSYKYHFLFLEGAEGQVPVNLVFEQGCQ